jgi:transcriptional regulator with XRE-family HTH domain
MPEHIADGSVGGRIRLVRTKHGWTLEQLAEKAGISKSFLWEVERGSDIGGERLLRVANALGASLDYLMRGVPTEEEFKPSTVEIPAEVNALAHEAGLTYRQTVALLEIDRSVMAHRRDVRQVRDKAYWERLYEAVKPFLEEKR